VIREIRWALAIAVAVTCAHPAFAQSKSAPLAAELVQLLEQRKVQNVAAKDPDQPGFFVAASYAPGLPLLVVSARSSAPDYVEYVLNQARYDEVYSSLNGASVSEGKLFVQDMGGNGLALKPENKDPLDIAYRDVSKTTIFNGEWKKQGLSEQEYKEAFDTIDAKYARALSLLLARLKAPAAP